MSGNVKEQKKMYKQVIESWISADKIQAQSRHCLSSDTSEYTEWLSIAIFTSLAKPFFRQL